MSMMVHNGGALTIQFLRNSYCCGLSSTSKRMILLLQELEGLTQFQKQTLINRYISLYEDFQGRAYCFAYLFHVGRFIVTVGSLIVPALLSIQYTTSTISVDGIQLEVYWTTWTLSLLVTTFNGILTLFKIDKKYYFLNTVVEQLQSEMWQYIHLTGKYGGKLTPGHFPTHDNQFVFFAHNMEKIKLKQVEEEYFKLIEEKDKTTAQNDPNAIKQRDNKMIAGLFTPTPDQQKLLDHQQEIAVALLQEGNLPNLIDGATIGDAQKTDEGGKGSTPVSMSMS